MDDAETTEPRTGPDFDAETREALTGADFDKYRDLYIESQRRAVLAHLTDTLRKVMDTDDPLIGIAMTGLHLKGGYTHFLAGAVGYPSIRGAVCHLEDMVVNMERERNPGMFPKHVWGDQLKVRDGEAKIVCGDDDEIEAGREKKENAAKLVNALIVVMMEFFHEEMPDSLKDKIQSAWSEVRGQLYDLDSERFYADPEPPSDVEPEEDVKE